MESIVLKDNEQTKKRQQKKKEFHLQVRKGNANKYTYKQVEQNNNFCVQNEGKQKIINNNVVVYAVRHRHKIL